MSRVPLDITADESAETLASIIKEKLGVDVKPKKLKKFIERNWHYLHSHAHNIFDVTDLGKRIEARRMAQQKTGNKTKPLDYTPLD